MTLNDIKNEVAVLGFETEPELDASLVFAVKRALGTIYTERSVYGTIRLFQSSPRPISRIKILRHKAGETVALNAKAGSFTMRTVGRGELTVNDDRGKREEGFAGGALVFGNIYGNGTLTFTGEGNYTVFALTFFDTVLADGESPVEYGTVREYELALLADDYLCVASEPTDADGKAIKGAALCYGKLTLPYEYEGEVSVRYRRAAPKVSIDTPDEEIGVPEELKFLVALLTAAYYWLDDDAEKAQYYRSLYREGMSAVKLYNSASVGAEYRDTTRWA